MKDDYRMYPACTFHKESRTIFILGGLKNDVWVGTSNKLRIGNENLESIDDIPESLKGPVATIPQPDVSPAVVYVSGININN